MEVRAKIMGRLMGEDLRGVALSMLRPVSASILTKKGTLIIIQVHRQLEISFDISDDFIDRIFFFSFVFAIRWRRKDTCFVSEDV